MTSLAAHPRTTEPAERSAMVLLDDVVRVFGRGGGQVRVLDGVTLSMAQGTFTAIMGPSGSGKSTLLQIAAGLDRATPGRGAPLGNASSRSQRASARPPARRTDRLRLSVVQPARRADGRAERRAAGTAAGAAILGLLAAAVTTRLALRASPAEVMRGKEWRPARGAPRGGPERAASAALRP
jgi:energy-coupling factor transporter ATP-binding protein EcfA2